MEVYPIIYTRNYYMDYAPNFYVCPSFFNEQMTEKSRKYILEALNYANMIHKKRRILVTGNGYTVLGVVTELEEIMLEKWGECVIEYCRDNKGRSIVAFIGIVFKNIKLPQNYIPKNIDEVLYSVSERFIINRQLWYDKEENHHIGDKFDIEIKAYVKKNILVDKMEYGKLKIFYSTEECDNELFLRLIAQCGSSEKKYSFCSDYYGIESIAKTRFKIITSRYFEKIMRYYGEKAEHHDYKGNKLSFGSHKKQKKTKKIIEIVVAITIIIMIVIWISRGD